MTRIIEKSFEFNEIISIAATRGGSCGNNGCSNGTCAVMWDTPIPRESSGGMGV